VAFVFLESIHDVRKIEALTKKGRFQVSVYRISHFRRLSRDADNVENIGLVQVGKFLRRWHSSKVEPLVVMFADVKAKGARTDLGAVLREINRHRLKKALPSAMGLGKAFSGLAGLDNYDANWQNYESLYLTKEERRKKPAQGFTSANVIAAKKPEEFAHLMFRDQYLSELR